MQFGIYDRHSDPGSGFEVRRGGHRFPEGDGSGTQAGRASIRAPWQNGLAERWVGSCRREILDHVIALNEAHLRRLVRDYATYHRQDRIHDSLAKDTPNKRPVELRPAANSTVISIPRLGGLHHRYAWRPAP